MTDQTNFSDPGNDPHAYDVIRAIERFVETFENRTGSHAGKVICDNRTLNGRKLEQQPEWFVFKELIKPVAEALNHEIRFQPKGFDGLEGRIPDFTLLTLGIENFGELKKPGGINNARSESVEYLDMATERPIVGIATDGFTWILYTAWEGEDPQYTEHKRIYNAIRKIRSEQAYEEADRKCRRKLRQEVYPFVNSFGQEKIESRF